MKKAKVALTAIAVMGIVGGALAFNAKKAYSSSFVVTSTPGACSNVIEGRVTSDATSPFLYYTSVGNTNCPVANYTQITSAE